MSGHSHWAGIKHKKEANDKKRAQVFAKAARLITVAARVGGGDPDMNATLRTAIEKARSLNMPKDNIDRAVKKGVGGVDGEQFEETTMEAYGPAGTAILIKVITDNKNRTLSDVRHVLNQHQGKIAEGGSVQWLFDRTITFSLQLPSGQSKDDFELSVIDAGATDTQWDEDTLFAYCAPDHAEGLRTNLEKQGIAIQSSELEMRAKTEITVDSSTEEQLHKLLEALDDLDDVQDVYSNVSFT